MEVNQADTLLEGVYLTFEELAETGLGVEIYVSLLSSPNWREQFDGITGLRIVNKFRWGEYSHSGPSFMGSILTLLDSPRSCLVKNALMLVSETFMAAREGTEFFIQAFVQPLLLKSVNEKSFLKSVSREALFNAADNCACESLVSILMGSCFNKSAFICDTACEILSRMVPNIPPLLAFNTCAILLDSKRKPILNLAQDTLRRLKLEELQFEEWLLASNAQDKIRRAVEPRYASKTGDFRSFIGERKKARQGAMFELVE
jgi:hypothetical protein